MSQLSVLSCRALTSISPTASGRYLIQAAMVREYMAANGRSVPQTFRVDDFDMRPGSIYMALSGLIFPGISSAAQMQIRASEEAWRVGLQVLRQDFVGKNRELVLWFSVLQGTKFTRNVPLFEMELLAFSPASRSAPASTQANLPANSPMAPGEVLLAPQGERRMETIKVAASTGPVPSDVGAQAAVAAKAVNDWLNSPDKHAGKVVNTPDVPVARPLALHRASGASISTADASQRIDDRDLASVDYSQASNPDREQAMDDFARGKPVDPAFMSPTARDGAILTTPPLPLPVQPRDFFAGLAAVSETPVTEVFLPPPLPPVT
jgi:hypothetical protein